MCVCECITGLHACASVCVKGGSRYIRDLVLYDVWHDMRRHAWNKIGCWPALGSACIRGPISFALSGLRSDKEKHIYSTLPILISCEELVTHDT